MWIFTYCTFKFFVISVQSSSSKTKVTVHHRSAFDSVTDSTVKARIRLCFNTALSDWKDSFFSSQQTLFNPAFSENDHFADLPDSQIEFSSQHLYLPRSLIFTKRGIFCSLSNILLHLPVLPTVCAWTALSQTSCAIRRKVLFLIWGLLPNILKAFFLYSTTTGPSTAITMQQPPAQHTTPTISRLDSMNFLWLSTRFQNSPSFAYPYLTWTDCFWSTDLALKPESPLDELNIAHFQRAT